MNAALDVAGFEHRFVEANGLRHHVVVGGPPTAPLVLLLHGFPEGWQAWRHVMGPLRDAGFFVVAADLRGYGGTDRPEGVEAYALATLAADVAGLVEALGRSRAHVVGHDWGGAIALHVARTRPAVIDRLVVMNAADPASFARQLRRPAQLAASWYIFFFQLPWLPERMLAARDFAVLRDLFRRDPRRPQAYTDDEIDAYIASFSRRGALTAALAYYRASLRVGRPRRRSSSAVARRPLETPTLVLWGLDDRALLPETVDGIQRRFRDARVVRVPDCSHWIHHDAPEAVVRACIPFLRDEVVPDGPRDEG